KLRNRKFRRSATLAKTFVFRCEAASLFRLEKRIERSLAISFEIHRDEGESRGFYSSRDFFCHFRPESTREFVRRQFDARQFTVRSHTKLAEVKFAKSCFGAFYFGKQLGRDGDS